MKFDLHTHTTASDGTDTPAQLIERAANLGFELIAVTDHDTVSGLAEAKEAGERRGVRVIPGVEISAGEETEVHVLGYGMRDLPRLEQRLADMRQARRSRMHQMIERLRAAGVTPVLRILQSFEENDGFFHDGQNVRIAGMVEEIRRKTTRNGSMMAYVTLEDDTAAMELLTFSNVLERSGSLLTENAAVVAEGRISVRDEKAPQLVVNRFDPLESFTKQAPPPMAAAPRPAAQEQAVLQASRLYLRLPSEQSPLFGKVRATLNMFPGNVAAVLYFADTGVRRGTQCGLRGDMLQELRALLGEDSIVLK